MLNEKCWVTSQVTTQQSYAAEEKDTMKKSTKNAIESITQGRKNEVSTGSNKVLDK